MIKRIMSLLVIGLIAVASIYAAGIRTSVVTFTLADTFIARDTMIDSVRIDADTIGPIELNGADKLTFVSLAEIQDTNFTADTTRVLLFGGRLSDGDTIWALMLAAADTIIKNTTSDTTTFTTILGLDSIPYDFMRFIVSARDSLEASKPGLFGNTYHHACVLSFRRAKD